MKISIELSDIELKTVQAATGEKKKGTAIRKLVLEALQLKKRWETNDKILAGKWSVNLPETKLLRRERPIW